MVESSRRARNSDLSAEIWKPGEKAHEKNLSAHEVERTFK